MPIDEEPGIITQHSFLGRRTDVAGLEPQKARRDLFARRGAMAKSVRQLVLWQSHVEPAIGDIDLYDVMTSPSRMAASGPPTAASGQR